MLYEVLESEDDVRDQAKEILGFNINEKDIRQGTGQLTTFNMLGFKDVNDRPDGWYLPKDKSKVAIILETKSPTHDIEKQIWANELLKNVTITQSQYNKVVGILYNGVSLRVFKGSEEVYDSAPVLQHKNYYISLYTQNTIDKKHIYEVTKRINDSLHFDFGMTDLQDRMIFTACALVAQRYNPNQGLERLKGMPYNTFKNWIYDALAKAIEDDKRQNIKLNILLEEYSMVRMSITEKQEAIDKFIDNVCEIADLVNSDYWNGEDVMAIFFNEFNRYRGKSDAGQVFTPDHITSLMYRLIDVNQNDRVLDAACGSGAFLVKAMCNMMKESGGVNTNKAKIIKSEQLFGIELYRKVFALACANMMIHKDGKTNLEQLDSRTDEACAWIRSISYQKDKKGNFKKDKNGNLILTQNPITKVLMNPPFERKYGCMQIVNNVLMNVPPYTLCAFILPDKKLEKAHGKKLLKHSTLKKIIKLPEKIFSEGVATSIFIFEAGIPQNNKEIFTCYIKDDGLETVKNQGRQDIRGRWQKIEDDWVEIIHKQSGSDTIQWIKPAEHLSYQMPEPPFKIFDEDFTKVMMDYLMFKKEIDAKEFRDALAHKVLYDSIVYSKDDFLTLTIKAKGGSNEQN